VTSEGDRECSEGVAVALMLRGQKLFCRVRHLWSHVRWRLAWSGAFAAARAAPPSIATGDPRSISSCACKLPLASKSKPKATAAAKAPARILPSRERGSARLPTTLHLARKRHPSIARVLLRRFQQFRQLSYVGRHPPRLVTCERAAPPDSLYH
jgi:hypothetical protein